MNSLRVSTKAVVTVSSLISIALVVFIAVTANFYVTKMSENNQELYKAYNISELLKTFKNNMTAFDAQQRNYFYTGDAAFLEQYQQKQSEARRGLSKMEEYFPGRPQEGAFERLRRLSYKKLLETKGMSMSSENGNLLPGNNNSMDEINQAIEELNSGLSETTQELIANNGEYLNVSKKWSLLETLLGVLVALAGVIILFRDINLRNKLEAELRNAKKQAEDNANMKEQFMANMSHEIRTPMNAILGFSDLMRKTKLSSDQEQYMKAISASSSNLLNIINDILDFSKIEAGKMHLEKIAFELGDVVNTVAVMFGERAREKKIDLEVHIDPAIPPRLFGDPTRLTQIMVNLLSNAVKFTSQGMVGLSCELKTIEMGVAQLVFRVKDTGIGIPNDKVNMIFERFNQGNSETTRKYGGTGLGLAIVKNLVELQNGTIYVKSREGKGTEFVVTVSYPVSYHEGDENQETSREIQRRTGDNRPVLLVEDNVLNQQLARVYLEGFGFVVDIVANGALALEMLRVKKFDLILMDVQMPVLDGYDTTRRIRSELKLLTPVIAMTAHVTEGEKEKCLNAGMNDYISKPFRETQLFDVIDRQIGNSHKQEPESKHAASIARLPRFVTQMLNLDEFYSLSRGSADFIVEMAELFDEQNPVDIEELENAVVTNNFIAIRATAHRMKSSLGFMGMIELARLMGEMELLAEKDQDQNKINKLFMLIKPGCATAREELSVLVKRLSEEVINGN
mgnify:CR=1 FL=1